MANKAQCAQGCHPPFEGQTIAGHFARAISGHSSLLQKRQRGMMLIDWGCTMKRAILLGLAASTMLAGTAAIATANGTSELIVPDAAPNNGEAMAVSPDGMVIVGHRNGEAVVWDHQIHQWAAGDPFKSPLSTLGGAGSVARGISSSTLSPGRHTIVGDANNPASEQRGFVSTYNVNNGLFFGLQDIGTLNGGNYVSARGISETDRVIVGFARDGVTNKMQAFRITADDVMNGVPNAMQSLGALGGLGHSRAYGISGDGTVIVGSSHSDTSGIFEEAVMWTAPGAGVELGKINNGDASAALGTDFYGNVIVGWATDGADGASKAFRWTQPTGMVSLGALPGGTSSRANAISSLGSVIVGSSMVTGSSRGFRWTEGTGMQTVEEWLTASGATLAGMDLTSSANGVNSDGSVVVGQTVGGQMFIARGDATAASGGSGSGGSGASAGGGSGGSGSPGSTGNTPAPMVPEPGMITVADLGTSLSDAGTTTSGALSGMSIMLSGAGSRPLDRLVDTGRSLAWSTGDLGLADDSPTDGRFGLGEIGVGHNFGAFQANAAVGYARQDYDGLLGGETVVDSFYGKGELLARIHGDDDSGIWIIASGAVAAGSADLRRNYRANGGLIATSRGDTNVEALGLRGRLQWQNALPFVSPFGEIGWSQACIDAYTETGGPFPARFAGKCDSETLARYGVDVTVPVNDSFRLTGTLSGVHRIGGATSATTGQVVGLQAFSVPGTARPAAWARGGLGFEADIANRSTLSFMANGTVGEGSASGWISTSIKMRF